MKLQILKSYWLSKERRAKICFTLLMLFCAATLLNAAVASACSVPVFRYALERWKPATYEVTILHNGPLNEREQAIVAQLKTLGVEGENRINVSIHDVDLKGTDETVTAAWRASVKTLGDDRLPQVVVRFPGSMKIADDLWTGSLSDAPQVLVESAAAKQIVSRLSGGQSAVWVLVESGIKDLDDGAAATLEQELTRLQKSLKLPLPDPNDPPIQSSLPLKIEFSILRISRTEATEKLLVHSLLHSEADLRDSTQPVVFPVFGRGRALFGLVGKGINADNIEHAAVFATGACACEVKDATPGFDLPLAAEWDRLLDQRLIPERPPELKGLSEFLPNRAPKVGYFSDATNGNLSKTADDEASDEVDLPHANATGSGSSSESNVVTAGFDAKHSARSKVIATSASTEVGDRAATNSNQDLSIATPMPGNPNSALLRNTLMVVLSGLVVVAALTAIFFRRF